tara:strand:- start:16 stop:897 length:882 start_codon:yes stop_codon:yes gene_type:complete
MNKKALLITGGNGYILKNFNFESYKSKFDLFFIHNKKNNVNKLSYSEEDLKSLSRTLDNENYTSILIISFGSHLGGDDPGLYFNSVSNLEKLLNNLVDLNKKIYIYHSSSFSIFNPTKNSSLFSLLINDSVDIRGPYSYSKKNQNKLLKEFSQNRDQVMCEIVHIGHVYDKKNTLAKRFLSKSFKFYKFIFSMLYSPMKLINPTSIDSIHNDLQVFLRDHENHSLSISQRILTDNDSPIPLFKVFLKEKLFFISPLPLLICTFSPLIIRFLPRYSNVSFILKKYLQMNNSIKM